MADSQRGCPYLIMSRAPQMQEEMADADMPGKEELQAVADEEGLPVEQCVIHLPLIINICQLLPFCHPIVSALLLERRQGVPGFMYSDVSAGQWLRLHLWSTIAGCVLRWRHHRPQLSS